ncbi:recombinase family protein [Microbulbifer yueqingensis]|uniref:Site-specific DNA recombinase n=1 Tax=Microbulbifer yueqingensis TaxID=658219 RepID=A0A1G9EGD9_9GAMM|nr:recombinase family protein [Microbulbifer yueqingensis]SDK75121.1 Site-specific DNA recombinase [Microbulbifer yueqingensis]
MGETIGYARVSTSGQKIETQALRLQEHGCSKVFQETYTGGSTTGRKALLGLLEYVREGDSVVVTKLDRLARSAMDLGQIASTLEDKKVDLVVLDQKIDTSSPAGKLMFNLIGAFAEFERDLIRERVQEGVNKAKEKGVQFGRKAKLTKQQLESLRNDFAEGELSKGQLAEKYGLSRSSVYRLVKSEH